MRAAAATCLLLLLASGAASARTEFGAGPITGLGEGLPVCEYIPRLAYPAAVAERYLGGTVTVRVYVDESGRVYDAELLDSELPELFIVEALKTARLSRFRPAQRAGRGQRATALMPMRFLPQAPPPAVRPEPVVAEPEPAAAEPAPVVDRAPAEEKPVAAEPAVSGQTTPPPSDDPPARPETPATRVRVVDAGFGTGVSARELLGRGEVFAVGDRVHFWMSVEGARPGETLKHVWIFRGRAVQEIPLTMKESSWRSWSYKTLFAGMTGAWLLELRDESGHLIGSWSFHCE